MIEYTVQVDKDSTTWRLNGQRHRVDGPAIEYTNSHKSWYQNGQRHRVDGPAIEYADGDKMWYLNGQRHRESGPAIEWADGHKEWFLNGVEATQADVMKPVKQLTVAQIEVLLGYSVKVVAG